MKLRAYLESSIWNRIVDRRDANRRRLTRRFLRIGSRKLHWFLSAAVTSELNNTPDTALRRQLERQVAAYRPRIVPWSLRAERVFEDLRGRDVGPASKAVDVLHVAMAIAGRMNYLVTWDQRDLATERVNRRVRAYVRERGYNELRIGTPAEVIEWISCRSI